MADVEDMLLCFGETQKAARRRYLQAMRIGADPDHAAKLDELDERLSAALTPDGRKRDFPRF